MNTKQYKIILSGVKLWNKWRKENPEVTPDLWGADLRKADLRGADLREADLYDADLREADLWRANLWRSSLRSANLRGANLRGANLREADLYDANLRRTTNTQGIFTFGPAGSRNDISIYVSEYDQLRCGCWAGTLAEFAETVENTHNNPVFLAQYRLGIEYFRGMKKIWEENLNQ